MHVRETGALWPMRRGPSLAVQQYRGVGVQVQDWPSYCFGRNEA